MVCLVFLRMVRPGLQASVFHGLYMPSKAGFAFNTAKETLLLPFPPPLVNISFNKEAAIRAIKSHDARPYSHHSPTVYVVGRTL